jgi:hypothetical protein
VQVNELEPMLQSVMEYFELIAGIAPIPVKVP